MKEERTESYVPVFERSSRPHKEDGRGQISWEGDKRTRVSIFGGSSEMVTVLLTLRYLREAGRDESAF